MKHNSILVLMLLLLIVTFVNADPVDLFEEGFETIWPTPGWTMSGCERVSATTTTDPLGLVEPTIPYEGNYCVGMSSYEFNYLISPLKNNPGEYFFFVHKKDTGNHQFLVEFQEEDGVSDGPDLTGTWVLVSGDWSSQGWWEPLIINLTGFDPGYVRIKPAPPPPLPLKYMYFDRVNPYTVPVELSSFTAALVQQPNQQYLVKLQWTTQTETQVAGYTVYRNSTTEVSSALQLNLGMIAATNTSMQSDYEYTDSESEPGTMYYWLQSNDMNGSVQLFGPISITINSNQSTTGPGIVSRLNDIYPNPFITITNIPFQLTSKGDVKLEIFNQKGQLVWTYKKDSADGGLYQIDWNGRDMNGKPLTSGVYLCRMTSNAYTGIKKLVLQK